MLPKPNLSELDADERAARLIELECLEHADGDVALAHALVKEVERRVLKVVGQRALAAQRN